MHINYRVWSILFIGLASHFCSVAIANAQSGSKSRLLLPFRVEVSAKGTEYVFGFGFDFKTHVYDNPVNYTLNYPGQLSATIDTTLPNVSYQSDSNRFVFDRAYSDDSISGVARTYHLHVVIEYGNGDSVRSMSVLLDTSFEVKNTTETVASSMTFSASNMVVVDQRVHPAGDRLPRDHFSYTAKARRDVLNGVGGERLDDSITLSALMVGGIFVEDTITYALSGISYFSPSHELSWNSVEGGLKIHFGSAVRTHTLEIYSVTGDRVLREVVTSDDYVCELPSGIYFLRSAGEFGRAVVP